MAITRSAHWHWWEMMGLELLLISHANHSLRCSPTLDAGFVRSSRRWWLRVVSAVRRATRRLLTKCVRTDLTTSHRDKWHLTRLLRKAMPCTGPANSLPPKRSYL
jgi:hypothetical protein